MQVYNLRSLFWVFVLGIPAILWGNLIVIAAPEYWGVGGGLFLAGLLIIAFSRCSEPYKISEILVVLPRVIMWAVLIHFGLSLSLAVWYFVGFQVWTLPIWTLTLAMSVVQYLRFGRYTIVRLPSSIDGQKVVIVQRVYERMFAGALLLTFGLPFCTQSPGGFYGMVISLAIALLGAISMLRAFWEWNRRDEARIGFQVLVAILLGVAMGIVAHYAVFVPMCLPWAITCLYALILAQYGISCCVRYLPVERDDRAEMSPV